MKKKVKKTKTKTKISTGQLVFQIVNTILVVGILGFYIGRLFYFKEKLEVVYNSTAYTVLSDLMIQRNDILSEDRLYPNEDGSYTFKGKIENNYIEFCGQIFRAISIDPDGNIKAITNEPVGVMMLSGSNHLDETALNDWLNKDAFEKTVDEYSAVLRESEFNYSVIDNYQNIPTDHVYTDYVGLLTLDEYITSGGPNGFLNFNQQYWLGNSNSNGQYYFVDENGSIGTSYSETLFINVRPVININFSLKALRGTGTAEDPYVLNNYEVDTITDAAGGRYVKYADLLWRVTYKTEDGDVKLILDDVLRNEEEPVLVAYGTNATFSTKEGVGKYLYSKDLGIVNEDYLVETTWGLDSLFDSYDYREAEANEYTGYVGLPTLKDLYLTNDMKYRLSYKVNQSVFMMYSMNNSILYTELSDVKSPVKPLILMKGDIKIVEGEGTKDSPYVLEVITHE